jgi:hypothetical protein
VSPAQTVAATLIVTLGSLLQGTVGFGLGLFAAPLLLLVDPRLVPGPLLIVSGLLTTLMARRDWDSVRTGDLGWSLAGRVLGTGPALLALAVVPTERIEYLLGGIVLLGVLLTGSGFHIGLSPASLFGAGFFSGFMGTTTTIGGPPMALVYQHETGPRIRGTLSAFFVAGVVISVAGLLLAGRFGVTDLTLGLLLMPGAAIGFFLSRHTAGTLDGGYVRPAVLVVSAVAGVAVILKEVLF